MRYPFMEDWPGVFRGSIWSHVRYDAYLGAWVFRPHWTIRA